MEFIWTLLLTACLTDTICKYQDVQWFDEEQQCREMLPIYSNIPADGDWDTVEYICKPVGSELI